MRIALRSRIATPVVAVVTLLFSLAFAPEGSAEEPGLLYGTAGNREFVAFNLNAGRVRVIGDIGFPGSLSLAFCRPGVRPYTIIMMGNPAFAHLASLALDTGAATLVGSSLGSPLGRDYKFMGMTCSPDGTLYAVGQPNSLYIVDRETGQASLVGPTDVPGIPFSPGYFTALDFAPDGTLYGANATALYTIDPMTGHATKVVDFTGVTGVAGLAIGKDWIFYVSDSAPQSSIYTVDISTGAATAVLNTGLAYVRNIAFKFPGK